MQLKQEWFNHFSLCIVICYDFVSPFHCFGIKAFSLGSKKTKENITHKRGQPLLRHETQIAKKDQQKKHLLKMVSKKLLECPNLFDGANCTLIFDMDQDK